MYATGALANLRAYDPSPPEDPALEALLKERRLRDVIEAMQAYRTSTRCSCAVHRTVSVCVLRVRACDV